MLHLSQKEPLHQQMSLQEAKEPVMLLLIPMSVTIASTEVDIVVSKPKL